MSPVVTEVEGCMCPYYERDEKSPDWFYCKSPKNPNPGCRFCGSGADKGRFMNYCISPHGGDGKKICSYYPAKVPAQERVPVQTGGGNRGRTAGVDAAGNTSGGSAGSRYTFVREKNMCMYWSRDEEQEKKYHCASPGNPEGPGEAFPTTGGFDSVGRFRKQCRKADEEGVPPCCEFFPGGGSAAGDEEDSGSGEIVKKVVKAAVKTAVNPGGSIVEGIVTNLIDDL